jgi:hypothetical protein
MFPVPVRKQWLKEELQANPILSSMQRNVGPHFCSEGSKLVFDHGADLEKDHTYVMELKGCEHE